MSGRIADIAINPNNENEWYVAVGSGGVWKTVNSGTTWNPIADDQPFYSTGCITIDPHNSSKIWLGTGENVGEDTLVLDMVFMLAKMEEKTGNLWV